MKQSADASDARPSSETAANKNVLLTLCAITALDMVGFGIVLPLLPFYAERFGASPAMIAVIIACFPAMQLLSSGVIGRLSDRYGRRPVLILGLYASAASYALFGFANSVAILVISRMAAGMAGATVGVAQALVADVTTPRERAKGIGLLGASYGVGVVIGPAIGAYFSTYGLEVAGFVAAGLCFLNGVVAQQVIPETVRGRDPARRAKEALSLGEWLSAYSRFPLVLLIAIYFLGLSAFDGTTAVTALLFQLTLGVDARLNSFLWIWAGLVSILMRGVAVGALAHRMSERRVVALGAAILVAGLAYAPFAPRYWLAMAAVGLTAAGAGLLFPCVSSLISQSTGGRSVGAVMGGAQAFGGVAKVAGPIWTGFIFQFVGPEAAFIAASAAAAFACVMALGLPRSGRADLSVGEPSPT